MHVYAQFLAKTNYIFNYCHAKFNAEFVGSGFPRKYNSKLLDTAFFLVTITKDIYFLLVFGF